MNDAAEELLEFEPSISLDEPSAQDGRNPRFEFPTFDEPLPAYDECDYCGGDGCAVCCNCIPRRWISFELRLLWRRSMSLPVLVTNGGPNPRTLFGGERVGGGLTVGGRLDFGVWLDDRATAGIGATFFGAGEKQVNFDSNDTGEADIVRPFLQNGVPTVLVVNNPAGVVGNVTAQTTSEILGADVYHRRLIWSDPITRIDLLTGYKMSRIDESLVIRHRFTAGGTLFDGFDRFMTTNEFHGGAMGVLAKHQAPRWSVEVLGRLGLGNMRGNVAISGSDLTGLTNNASLLARSSNAGLTRSNQFTAVRELGIKFAYQVRPNAKLTAGYSFMHWKHVLQPGDQVNINLPNPQLILNDSSYYIHGLDFGLMWRF